MKLSILTPTFLCVALTASAALEKRSHGSSRHANVERSLEVRSNHTKREACSNSKGARATYYDTGLGACGGYNSPSDYIVALSAQNWGNGYPGPQCQRQIVITANGKTATATITDECMGCPACGIDMSQGLFEYFVGAGQALNVGVLAVDWTWAGESAAPAPAPYVAPAPPYVAPAPPYVAPYVAPAPPPAAAYTPPTSTYVAPYVPPTTTSVYVAPTPEYTPPTTTSVYVAPTTSSSSSSSYSAPSSSIRNSSTNASTSASRNSSSPASVSVSAGSSSVALNSSNANASINTNSTTNGSLASLPELLNGIAMAAARIIAA